MDIAGVCCGFCPGVLCADVAVVEKENIFEGVSLCGAMKQIPFGNDYKKDKNKERYWLTRV